MNVDPVIEEIHEARRKLWDECDGTLEGYSRHCEEVAREFRARVAAEVARKKAAGTWTRAGSPGDGAAEGTAALADGAMLVCEDAPGYGAGDRKGAEGDG
jgi:hypothetical protein